MSAATAINILVCSHHHQDASDAQKHTAVPMLSCYLVAATAVNHGITVRHFQAVCHLLKYKFHHLGCHQPPVSDSELIARIKAFNDGDIENSIHEWMCRRCLKRRGSSAVPSSIHMSGDPQSSSTDPLEIVNPEHNITVESTQPVQPVTSQCVKYNLSPSWIHNRHPNLQKPPPRLTRKGTSRKVSASKFPLVVARDTYNFSCISWLMERRELGSSMQ
jgi:hypothetical protein